VNFRVTLRRNESISTLVAEPLDGATGHETPSLVWPVRENSLAGCFGPGVILRLCPARVAVKQEARAGHPARTRKGMNAARRTAERPVRVRRRGGARAPLARHDASTRRRARAPLRGRAHARAPARLALAPVPAALRPRARSRAARARRGNRD